MSEEQLIAFLWKVKSDTSLQEKLKGADAGAVIAIAKTAGFVVSVDAIKIAQLAPQELSDAELEGLVGGYSSWQCATSIHCG